MHSVSHLNRVPWIVALVGALAIPSMAQQAAPNNLLICRNIRATQTAVRGYHHELEQRIAALEQQIAKQKRLREK